MNIRRPPFDLLRDSCTTFDQTRRADAVAQIQCIVQKGSTKKQTAKHLVQNDCDLSADLTVPGW
jgi:hypothetical protein